MGKCKDCEWWESEKGFKIGSCKKAREVYKLELIVAPICSCDHFERRKE